VSTFWKTAQEIQNDYFTVQKSADGERFEDVSNVDGQGDSDVEHSYSLMEPFAIQRPILLPAEGKPISMDILHYRRLVAVDYDGPPNPAYADFPKSI